MPSSFLSALIILERNRNLETIPIPSDDFAAADCSWSSFTVSVATAAAAAADAADDNANDVTTMLFYNAIPWLNIGRLRKDTRTTRIGDMLAI